MFNKFKTRYENQKKESRELFKTTLVSSSELEAWFASDEMKKDVAGDNGLLGGDLRLEKL